MSTIRPRRSCLYMPGANAKALEKAKTCRERYALLLRAKNQGDERTLALLRSYEKKSGCGKKGNEDCNECMRSDKRLEEAVEAVKARSKT